MVEFIIDRLHDTRFMVTLLTAVAAAATVITLAMPYVFGDNLERRMRAVSVERSQIRARERERLARGDRINLRQSPRAYMQSIVDQLNLRKWLGEDHARSTLIQAGYRGHGPYITFLFFRLVTPIVTLLVSALYVFVIGDIKQPTLIKFAIVLGSAWVGMRGPSLFLKNLITRRQLSIRRAFPDALDLMLICVESACRSTRPSAKSARKLEANRFPWPRSWH